MVSGWRYRVASLLGVVAFTVGAYGVANHPPVQRGVTSSVPVVARLHPQVLTGGRFLLVGSLTLVVVVGSLSPLFKPRPRRPLDTVASALKRLAIAAMALATIGYFDLSSRLPRSTLLVTFALLGLAIPVWFVAIRRRTGSPERAVVVGDDPDWIESIFDALDGEVAALVSPSNSLENGVEDPVGIADGGSSGVGVHSGGLPRLDDVLVDRDPDTAYLAFSEPDRGEFFGVLETCHAHGVMVKVPRDHAEAVLTHDGDVGGEEFVDVAIDPWDWQDTVVKRLFDVVMATGGLVVLSPAMFAIAVAIKLDSPGPVLYSQERTAEFGETFTVYKFRSMLPESENERPGGDEARVTRVGRFLRMTHLDEIPQLWTILVGEMSVVGPRAVWTAEEQLLEREVGQWRKRWFVKPGLTGLAQVNGVTSEQPRRKLRYDMEYIRRQSFWFDVRIVGRQVMLILGDVIDCLLPRA